MKYYCCSFEYTNLKVGLKIVFVVSAAQPVENVAFLILLKISNTFSIGFTNFFEFYQRLYYHKTSFAN